MQEPWGAYTWYAVNDHPSDKALYDFRITTPSPWTGDRERRADLTHGRRGGSTVTEWHLDEPAASYLVTVAIGDYAMSRERSASGVPITLWVPRDRPSSSTVCAPPPRPSTGSRSVSVPTRSSTAGIVLVESLSGMETQTMVTLGITDYTCRRR